MRPKPPALPRRLADPRPAITVATTAWFVATMVFLITGAPASWVWTCLIGALLGLAGFAVMHLQRNAAQRGSRLAQKGLL